MNELTYLSSDKLLAQATCAVLRSDQTLGTAWLVSNEGYLLTAGHVLGKEQPLDQVQVLFLNDERRIAFKVEHRFDQPTGLDFAVLKIESLPANRRPLPIQLVDEVTGGFDLHGYGEDLGSQASGSGVFLGSYYPNNMKDCPLFQLRSPELGIGGYSGGAVFSKKLQAVVAIQIEATKASLGPGRDTILALPLHRIADSWPPLKELPGKSTQNGYRFEVFLSYGSADDFDEWIRDDFLFFFKRWLRQELAREGYYREEDIRIKEEGTVGPEITEATKDALARSRCLVAMCYPTYFRQMPLQYEMAVMINREHRLGCRSSDPARPLIFPVYVHDGDAFPNCVAALEPHCDCKGLVREGIRKCGRGDILQEKIAQLAKRVALTIKNAPPWSQKCMDDLDPELHILDSLQMLRRPMQPPRM